MAAHLGPAGATLVWTLLLAGGGVLALVFGRYVGVLGAGGAADGTPERLAYDNLRARLSDGGSPTLIYGRLLTAFLNGVDRFFGDHDKAHLGVFQHAFWLRGSYPLWTGAASDRCLLLALIYPIVCILVIWAISGHVGPAEQVLGLPISAPEWQRGLLAGALAMAVIALWRCIATMFSEGGPAALLSRKALPWSASFVFAVAVAAVSAIDARGAVIGVLTATGAVAVAVGSVRAGNAAVGGAVAVAVTVGVAVIVASLPDVGSTGTPSVAIALATGAFDAAMMLFAVIWLIGVILLSYFAARRCHQGAFVSVFSGATVALIVFLALWLPRRSTGDAVGPLLLFLGLLASGAVHPWTGAAGRGPPGRVGAWVTKDPIRVLACAGKCADANRCDWVISCRHRTLLQWSAFLATPTILTT